MEYLESLRWVAQEYGLWAAIVIYFLIRDVIRDNRQYKVISNLQSEMRTVILPLVQETTRIIADNTAVLRENKSTITTINDTVNDCREMLSKCRLALSGRKVPVATGGD